MGTSRRKFLQKSILASSATFLSMQANACTENDKAKIPLKSGSTVQPLFSGIKPIDNAERTKRIEKAQTLMKASDIKGLYIESGTSLEYFTGIKWGRSERMTAAIIPMEGELTYICPAFEEARVRELITIDGQVRVWQEHESPYALVVNTLDDLNIKSGKIGIEENVRFFLFDGIRKVSSNLELVSAKSIIGKCRSIKSSTELELMRMANQITLEAYKIGFSQLTAGMSQYDFNAIVYKAFTDLGATETG